MSDLTLAPRSHTVAFHADDLALEIGLAEAVAVGLAAGDAVVVVATPDHCARVAADLGGDMDLSVYVRDGRYRDVDAVATLRAIRRDGGIDAAEFERLIGAVVDTAGSGGHRVRVVGELVGLMWDEGDVASSLELEELWNRIAGRADVVLNCAYPAEGGADLQPLCGVCASHSGIDESDALLPPGPAGDDESTVTRLFVPHRGAAVQARRHVERIMGEWNCGGVTADAVLLVSEMATNSVIHAGTPFRLTLSTEPGIVRISVTDGAPTLPVRRFPSDDEPGGRGMALIEMLSVASGADPVEGGKVVWAELAA